MAEYIQIGALVEKDHGLEAFQNVSTSKGVIYAFLETGRSNDLFSEKQFGEFGEAASVTVIAIQKHQEELFEKIFELADLKNQDQGIISTNTHLINALNEL